MRYYNLFMLLGFLFCNSIAAQTPDSLKPKWQLSSDLNLYFIPQNFILLPVIRADKDALHLESRYNYEDINTLSAWIGYNFSGGKKLEYTFTTMFAGVIGNSNGLAPGLEMTFDYKNFELYSEAEYLFDLNTNENNFFYIWTDFTYTANDWLSIGISAQRTRLYQTELDLQRGLIIAGTYKNLEVTTYFYDPFYESRFGLLTLTYNF